MELCPNKAVVTGEVGEYVALDGQIGRGKREVPLHLKYAYLISRGLDDRVIAAHVSATYIPKALLPISPMNYDFTFNVS